MLDLHCRWVHIPYKKIPILFTSQVRGTITIITRNFSFGLE